jgi:hypothetical protein
VARPRAQHGHVADAALVDQAAQLEVDLAGGQLARVEDGAVAVDLGDPRNLVVELDQAARVAPGVGLAGYRVQTITSPS